jgi:multiple sugar transport system substrate-binding protein
MNGKRAFIVILLAMLLTVAFQASAAGQQGAVEGPAVLEVWKWKSFVEAQNAYLEQQFRNFEVETGHKINSTFLPAEEIYRKQLAAVEARTFPDVSEIWAQNLDQFNQMGVLIEVADVFNDLNRKSPFSDLMATMVKYQGKIVGIPLTTGGEAHYWRKDILDDMGLKAPDTWVELKSTAKKITQAGDVYGFATALGRPATDGEKLLEVALWCNGASVMDKDGKPALKSPEAATAFEFVAGMVREDIMPDGITSWDDGANNRAYQTRSVAGIQNSASVYNYMNTQDKDLLNDTVIVPIPAGPAGRFTDTVPHAVGINKNTKYVKAAKDLVRYIMDLDRYNGWIKEAGGQIQPVYPALVSDPFWSDPYRKPFIEGGAKYGAYQGYPGPGSAAAGEIFSTYVLSDTIQKVIIDGWSVDRALDWGMEKVTEIYERWQ